VASRAWDSAENLADKRRRRLNRERRAGERGAASRRDRTGRRRPRCRARRETG